MKTKFKRFGKSSLSVLLSIMMILSTIIIGSVGTINASALSIPQATGLGSLQAVYIAGTMNSWTKTAIWKMAGPSADYGNDQSAVFYLKKSDSDYEFKLVGAFANGDRWYSSGGYTFVDDTIARSNGSPAYNINTGNSNDKITCISTDAQYIKIDAKMWYEYSGNTALQLKQTAVPVLTANITNKATITGSDYTPGDTFSIATSSSGGSGTNTGAITVTANNVDVTSDVLSGTTFTAPNVATATEYTIKYTVTDTIISQFDTNGYYANDTATITVAPSSSEIKNVSVKAKYSDDGTTYTETTEATASLTGDTKTVTNIDEEKDTVTGTAAVSTTPQNITVDGSSYKFVGWDVEAANTGTFSGSTFRPTEDGAVAVAKYHKRYDLSCNTATGGTITTSASSVPFGTQYTVTVTPNTGYELTTLTDSAGHTIANSGFTTTDGGATYVGTMPAADTTLTATFTKTVVRVYFYNKFDWPNLHAYAWKNSTNPVVQNAEWPGADIGSNIDIDTGLYYYDIPIENNAIKYDRIIFNTGSGGAETASATISLSDDGKVVIPKYDETGTAVDTSKTISNYTEYAFDTNYYKFYFYTNGHGSSFGGENQSYVYFTTNADGNNYSSHDISKRALTKVTNKDGLWYVLVKESDGPKYYTNKNYYIRFNNGDTSAAAYTVKIPFSSSNVGQVYKLNETNNGEGTTRWSGGWDNLANIGYSTDSLFQPKTAPDTANGQIGVWAKSGTIRDQGGYYNKYSAMAETTIVYTNASDRHSGNYNGFTYAEKAWKDSYNGNYRLYYANAEKGKTITITTTIDSTNRSKYYVKAFCINGDSVEVIKEPSSTDSRRTSGEYTCQYTIKNTDVAVEITPIYYYFENGNSDNFVTMRAEDYRSVKAKWGNTLSCYAYYTSGSDTGDPGANNKSSLSGYPGQPMVNIGGIYYMQLYKGDTNIGNIQGITLNNYVWDDIHGYYLRGFEDFNGLNNTSEDYDNPNYRKNNANAQTYDYDDFSALLASGYAQDIIFSFKARSRGVNPSTLQGDGNKPLTTGSVSVTDTTAMEVNDNISVYFGYNGWDGLVDYYDVPVDIFGNRLTGAKALVTAAEDVDENERTDAQNSIITNLKDENINYNLTNRDFLTENYVKSQYCTDKVYIVSDGYEDYYSVYKKSDTSGYIGRYATRWYVYTYNSTTQKFTFVGSMPPSAFIAGDDDDTFLQHVSDSSMKTEAEAAFEGDVEALRELVGKPAVITYESAIYSGGAGNQPGYRCDGRWYYSKEREPIVARTRILIKTDTGYDYTDAAGTTYKSDPYSGSTNVGTTTTASVGFTNDTLDIYDDSCVGKTAIVVQTDDSNDFEFTADSFKTVTSGETTKSYKFVGWYLETGSGWFNEITTETVGTRPMDSNAYMIAVYEEASTKGLVVNHNLYSTAEKTAGSPTVLNGSGSTYVDSIVVKDSSGAVLNTYSASNKSQIAISAEDMIVGSTDIFNDVTNIVEITIRTVPNSGSTLTEVYEQQDTSYIAHLGAASHFDHDTTFGTTNKYVFTVEDLFGENPSSVSTVKTIDLFSNLSSKTFTVKLKYYDRNLVNNQPANINTKARELDVDVTVQDGETIQQALTRAISVDKYQQFGNVPVDKYINNVLDRYYIWLTQKDAADEDGFQSLLDYRHPDSLEGTTDMYSHGIKYKKYNQTYTGNGINFASHTDCYSIPYGGTGCTLTSPEDWVTYQDADGNNIDYLAENIDETEIPLSRISSITIWAFNTPKTYKITVQAPDTTAATPEKVTATEYTNEYNKTIYTNTEGGKFPANQIGFYNQRLGDSEEGVDGNTSYLGNYGITQAFLGDRIEADSNAVATIQNVDTQLVFDGWYTVIDGKFVKITSSDVYGYRITRDMTIVAGYVLPDEPEATVAKKVGVSLMSNGVDYYALNGKNKVRLNTQMNVYGAIDGDPDILDASVIYVRLPATYTDKNNESQPLTSEVVANSNLLAKVQDDIINSSATDKCLFEGSGRKILDIDSIAISGVDNSVSATYISYTYSVTDGEVSLSNKNRVQFVFNINVEDYAAGGKYSGVVAFAAIAYDYNSNNQIDVNEWIPSDNYISYITNTGNT